MDTYSLHIYQAPDIDITDVGALPLLAAQSDDFAATYNLNDIATGFNADEFAANAALWQDDDNDNKGGAFNASGLWRE